MKLLLRASINRKQKVKKLFYRNYTYPRAQADYPVLWDSARRDYKKRNHVVIPKYRDSSSIRLKMKNIVSFKLSPTKPEQCSEEVYWLLKEIILHRE